MGIIITGILIIGGILLGLIVITILFGIWNVIMEVISDLSQ
jgi:hypothetical protein